MKEALPWYSRISCSTRPELDARRGMWTGFAWIIAYALVGSAFAAPAKGASGNPVDTSGDTLKAPHELWKELRPASNTQFLRLLLRLQSQRSAYLESPTWRGEFYQFLGTELAQVGRVRPAIVYYDQVLTRGEDRPAGFTEFYPEGNVRPADLSGFAPEDAVTAITALAANRRVVMINEAHHVPQHRLMALLLLESLRHEGYRYFSAEALEEDDKGLQTRGYPTLATGYYTAEPVMGEVVRTALRLGYQVVPYEYARAAPTSGEKPGVAKSLSEREEHQASNLRDRIFAKDPKSKVLIHAGWGHVSKRPLVWTKEDGAVTSIPRMAAQFARMTAIDPLVIDQTFLMEHSEAARNHPVYRAAVERGWLKERPIILRHADTKALFVPPEHAGAVDLVVLHAPAKEEHGRPVWLRLAGRQIVAVAKAPAARNEGMLLLQAFYPTEDRDQAIPADQIAYGIADPPPALVLPRGSFRTRVVDGEGKVVAEATISVEGK